jgi:hypothetical protein
VPVIDVESLVVNKKASGRPQDIADVAALEAGPSRPAGDHSIGELEIEVDKEVSRA